MKIDDPSLRVLSLAQHHAFSFLRTLDDFPVGATADVETLIASSYVTIHRATVGEATFGGGGINDGTQPQLLVMGMENFSGNANSIGSFGRR